MGNSESTRNITGGEENDRDESKSNWTNIAAGVGVGVGVGVAALAAGGLYSVYSSSSSSSVPVPNSDPGFGGVPSSSSSASSQGSDSVSGWQFPPMGWVKCNVDGSFLPKKESAGCGGVYRNGQGKWLYGFAKKLEYFDLTTAEINAIYTGLEVAWDLGCKKLIIESDSTAAVDLVNKGCSSFHPLAEAVDEARNYVINKEWEVKIVYLPRNYNKVADKLANESHKLMDGVLKKFEDCPDFCFELHSDDVSWANSLSRSRTMY